MGVLTRIASGWRAMAPEQRLATVAALGLLITMFFPWYGLQSLNRKTGEIHSHSINAFGDVSFVEAAVFQAASLRIGGKKRRIVGRNDGPAVLVERNEATIQKFAGERLRERLCGERLRRPHGDNRRIDDLGGSLLATFKRLLPPLLDFA